MIAFDAAEYARLFVKNRAAADRYWARCRGSGVAADAAMDDETVEKLKGLLKNKLSAEDHERVCAMLSGDGEAQDDLPEPAAEKTPGAKVLAGDAKAAADFGQMFPGLAAVKIDNSGIPIPRRPATAAADAAMFPGLSHIKLA